MFVVVDTEEGALYGPFSQEDHAETWALSNLKGPENTQGDSRDVPVVNWEIRPLLKPEIDGSHPAPPFQGR